MTLRMMRPRLATADIGCIKAAPKVADPFYSTPEYRAWALDVKRRAGWRCQDCGAKHVRLYADHVLERRDRPDLELDPNNGRCRCGRCHTTKTAVERARRLTEG